MQLKKNHLDKLHPSIKSFICPLSVYAKSAVSNLGVIFNSNFIFVKHEQDHQVYYQEISQGQDHLRRRVVDLHKLGRYFSGPLSKEPYFPRALLPRIVQKYNLFGLANTLPRSGQRAKISPSDDRKLVEHQVKHSVPIHSEVSIASGWTWRAPTGALTSK